MSKAKVIPFQPPVDDSDDDCDCPKCPPVGAPAWLATFADIATNLMAFFVLILGFANFDEPTFEKFAGAMRAQFGTTGLPGEQGDTIINLAPLPDYDDSEFDESAPGDGANSGAADESAKAVAQALRDALAQGSLEIETGSGTVTVRLPDVQGPEAALALADAIAAAAGGSVERSDATGQPLPGQDPALRATPETPQDPASGQPNPASGSDTAATDTAAATTEIRTKLSSMVLQSLFEEEIADGSLSVEPRDGKVLVTLGAGGSFTSGSADLSNEARDIMARIASATNRPNRSIIVTGHTDNVPVSGEFADNFDLAAARAASVVRELVATGQVDPARISAVSKGEFAPLADNATEEGRAKNRRIEIEISYDTPQDTP